MIRDSKGRVVVDLEVAVEDDLCDCYFSRGTYMDNGCPVGDAELDYITERYADVLEDKVIQNRVCAAEYAFEGDR